MGLLARLGPIRLNPEARPQIRVAAAVYALQDADAWNPLSTLHGHTFHSIRIPIPHPTSRPDQTPIHGRLPAPRLWLPLRPWSRLRGAAAVLWLLPGPLRSAVRRQAPQGRQDLLLLVGSLLRRPALLPAPPLRRKRRVRRPAQRPAVRRALRCTSAFVLALRRPAALLGTLRRPAPLVVGAVRGAGRVREPVRGAGAVNVPARDRPQRGGLLPGCRP
jgi:hypothetical protein